MDNMVADGVEETKRSGVAPRRRKERVFVPNARDIEIVRWVHEVRVTTRQQIQALLFTGGGRSRCQERLTLLTKHRYLDKLARVAPNVPNVYVISRRCVNGRRVLRSAAMESETRHRVAPTKLQHALDIATMRVQLMRICSRGPVVMSRWLDEDQLAPLMLRYGVLPDAWAQLLRTADGTEHRSSFFLEVERSGKSDRYWREKFRRYGKFYYGGDFERTFGVRALRVLIVFDDAITTPKRLQALNELAAQSRTTFLRFASFAAVQGTGDELLTAPIWMRPGDQTLSALYESHARGVDDDRGL